MFFLSFEWETSDWKSNWNKKHEEGEKEEEEMTKCSKSPQFSEHINRICGYENHLIEGAALTTQNNKIALWNHFSVQRIDLHWTTIAKCAYRRTHTHIHIPTHTIESNEAKMWTSKMHKSFNCWFCLQMGQMNRFLCSVLSKLMHIVSHFNYRYRFSVTSQLRLVQSNLTAQKRKKTTKNYVC